MTQKEIKQKAESINETSLDYHLSHAVFACNKMVENEFRRYKAERIKELTGHLQAAEKNNNLEKINSISIDLDRLGRPFRIYVEYFDDQDMDGGRVVNLPDSNQFVISLPENLLRQSRNEDGSYNEDGVKKLRQMMAHELGHIVLHIEELLEINGTQGTKLLSDEEEENEADIFAKELLALRHKRNKELYERGGWKAF